MEKVKTKISCYIFKAKIKTLSGTVLDSVDEEWVVFCSLSFVNCPGRFVQWLVTAVCRRSRRILMLALRHTGTWHGVAGKSPRRTNSSCLNAVILCWRKLKKKTQKVFYLLHLQVKFPHSSGERGVLAMRFHCQAGMAFCTAAEKKRWSFGWGKQLGGTLKVRQSRPGQVNCS